MTTEQRQVLGSAVFDKDQRFRFRLDRWWAEGPRAVICGCNPSIAGAEENDPTIHQCIALTAALGYPGFTMVNWSPLVATDPGHLKRWRLNMPRGLVRVSDEANYELLREVSEGAAVRIVAWGNLTDFSEHTQRVLAALSLDGRYPLMAFGFTRDGRPRHPMARGRQRLTPGVPLIEWKKATPPTGAAA